MATVCYAKNKRRAAIKIAVIVAFLVLVVVLAGIPLNDPALDRLKFNLNLGTLIGLVVLINVVSLLTMAILYAAYKWVRRDLKAPRSEDDPAAID
ncbi:MAG: hypothetical protein JWO78_24 [Micavibrio sp.]|nr:hypothetical protein [Micavibrio sp.]